VVTVIIKDYTKLSRQILFKRGRNALNEQKHLRRQTWRSCCCRCHWSSCWRADRRHRRWIWSSCLCS